MTGDPVDELDRLLVKVATVTWKRSADRGLSLNLFGPSPVTPARTV